MALDTTTRRPMVTGLFRDRDSAERAYQSISRRLILPTNTPPRSSTAYWRWAPDWR